MQDSDHPAGAKRQWYDDQSGASMDDPRLAATPEEIAYYNKLEEAYPDRPLDVTLAKLRQSSNTTENSL